MVDTDPFLSGGTPVAQAVKQAMDGLLNGVIGLERVKQLALTMYYTVASNRGLSEVRKVPLAFNFAFKGNPGTGKTTVGKKVAKLLHVIGARKSNKFVLLHAEKLR